jgi:hypothetical protein
MTVTLMLPPCQGGWLMQPANGWTPWTTSNARKGPGRGRTKHRRGAAALVLYAYEPRRAPIARMLPAQQQMAMRLVATGLSESGFVTLLR